MADAGRQTLRGPCAHPTCPKPTSSAGQWKLIPDGNTQPVRADATCLCKRDVCRHYFNLPPLQPAPRKRAALEMRSGSPDVAVGCALRDEPRPPFISEIAAIWGVRCASACSPPPPLSPADSPLQLRVHRHCNLAAMDAEAKGNALEKKVTEYCVHGHFKRSEADARGLWGAWWLPTRVLVKQLGRQMVEEVVKAFEAALADEREADFAAADAPSGDEDTV